MSSAFHLTIQGAALFISDTHFTQDETLARAVWQTIAAHQKAHDIQHVFFLGDMLHFYVGDADIQPLWFWQQIHTLCPNIYFMAGNRDFLWPRASIEKYGMHYLPDPCYILIRSGDVVGATSAVYKQYISEAATTHIFNGDEYIQTSDVCIMLTHGDAWCLQERAYQIFRKITRQGWLQGLFMHLPQAWRYGVARYFKEKSKQKFQQTSHKSPRAGRQYEDIDRQALQTHLKQLPMHCNYVIHGHIHQCFYDQIHLKKNTSTWRMVLSDWYIKNAQINAYYGFLADGGACVQLLKFKNI